MFWELSWDLARAPVVTGSDAELSWRPAALNTPRLARGPLWTRRCADRRQPPTGPARPGGTGPGGAREGPRRGTHATRRPSPPRRRRRPFADTPSLTVRRRPVAVTVLPPRRRAAPRRSPLWPTGSETYMARDDYLGAGSTVGPVS